MLFAALAERASTFTDAGAQLRAGVFEDRDGTEKQTCEDGDRRGEEQDRSIDADIMNAREPIGGENDKRARNAPQARPNPSKLLSKPRVRLSSHNSPAMRPQLAPRAARKANSWRRPSTRTRRRFATLAQAMSSTMPMEPMRTHKTLPASPTTSRFQRTYIRADVGVLEELEAESRRSGGNYS